MQALIHFHKNKI